MKLLSKQKRPIQKQLKQDMRPNPTFCYEFMWTPFLSSITSLYEKFGVLSGTIIADYLKHDHLPKQVSKQPCFRAMSPLAVCCRFCSPSESWSGDLVCQRCHVLFLRDEFFNLSSHFHIHTVMFPKETGGSTTVTVYRRRYLRNLNKRRRSRLLKRSVFTCSSIQL